MNWGTWELGYPLLQRSRKEKHTSIISRNCSVQPPPPALTYTLVHLHLGFLLSRHAQLRRGGGGAGKERKWSWCVLGAGVGLFIATYVIL